MVVVLMVVKMRIVVFGVVMVCSFVGGHCVYSYPRKPLHLFPKLSE